MGHLRVHACITLTLLAAGCPGEAVTPPRGDMGLDLAEWDARRLDKTPADQTAADQSIPPDQGVSVPDQPPPLVCTPGDADTRACGACDSGSQSRTCDDSGQWTSWGGCAGAETGYPNHPVSNLPVCPPYTWPAVFFAPHPDDETLAMGGAIKEHINGGRQVYVELLTQGEASGARAILQNGGSCPWHSGSHSYALTPTQFGQARVAEFLEAMVSLGVHGVTVSDLGDGNLTVSEVAGRIGFWEQHKPALGVSYKGTLGTSQSGAGGANHPDHIATWNALTTSGLADVRGYNSSFYTPSSGKPVNTHPLASSVCSAKTSAMAAYKLWSPTAGRYAVGYHSVASTFDSLASSCEEYVLYYMP